MSPQNIAHYRITGKLGQGGMGQVFRAVDTKLNREVAIKVIPETLTENADRMARFAREAQVLASLNHPNIAAIYGLEDCALVMELVPGQTLAERLAGGALPVEEALRICGQIAQALGAAHQKGIIHRDIKPANVKVTPEGRVKVLDFGLAKIAAESQTEAGDATGATTLTTITQAGVILGTPAYMSPEQVRSEQVDQRTDIWAFGCVLYELLRGRSPFPGASVAEMIASVLKAEPDWRALPTTTPAKVRDLLRRCLQKDARHRLQSIEEAHIEIEDALRAPIVAVPPEPDRAVDSLAVLPFANTSGDPQMEYLSDGLTESIIFTLSQLPKLRVMSRSAVFRFKGRNEEAQEIGPDAWRRCGTDGKNSATRRDAANQRGAGRCRKWLATMGCAVQAEVGRYFRDGRGDRQGDLGELAPEAHARKGEPARKALHRQCRSLPSLFEGPVLLGEANRGRSFQGHSVFPPSHRIGPCLRTGVRGRG